MREADFRKAAERQGWEIEVAKSGHEKWRCPVCRGVVTASSTASDRRAGLNHLSRLRKHGFSWQGRQGEHQEPR